MINLERVPDDDWATLNRVIDKIRGEVDPPMPNARVFNSVAIGITNAVDTTLTFDSERWDVGGLHSTSSNTSRLTAPIAGLYSIGAHVSFDAAAGGYRYIYFVINGATIIALDTQPPTGAGTVTELNLTTEYRLAVGDFVEVRAQQNSGGAINVSKLQNRSPEFWMHRLGGYTTPGV